MAKNMKRLKRLNWNTPQKRLYYFTMAIVALASLCGFGNWLQTATEQDWHQLLRAMIIASLPFSTALFKAGLVLFIARLSYRKASEFARGIFDSLPDYKAVGAVMTSQYHLIHWSLATLVAAYVVDQMLLAYFFVAIYFCRNELSGYISDIAAGFALVSTAKVKVGTRVIIEGVGLTVGSTERTIDDADLTLETSDPASENDAQKDREEPGTQQQVDGKKGERKDDDEKTKESTKPPVSGARMTVETVVTGTLREVGLFFSTVEVEGRVRKIQNNVLWKNWVETEP